MSKKIGFISALCALAGCAGAVSDEAMQMDGSEPLHSQTATSMGSDPAMVGIGMPFEVLAKPEAHVDACVQLSIPLSDAGAAHAPALQVPAGGAPCFGESDGMTLMLLPAKSQVILSLTGAGMMRSHLQLTTPTQPSDMKPTRLPGDVVIAAAYAGFDVAAGTQPHTAVIETPADGATVTLRSGRSERAATPVYVDAEGHVAERSSSLAGGWAVFPNLPEGVHTVSMQHPDLRCAASRLASWSDADDEAITLVTVRDPEALPIVPNSIAHSNAFECH